MGAALPFNSVMVVGVNTRPTVKSAKALGLKTIAVDCFGDVDLLECADIVFSLKSSEPRQPKDAKRPSLFKLAAQALEAHDVDAMLLTSGTEHHPHLIEELGKRVKIIGNDDPTHLQVCKDKEKLFRVADKLGIPHPITYKVQTEGEALRAADDIGYPVVLKPAFGGGGIGIRLVESPEELKRSFKRVLLTGDGESLYVQEYILGIDVSASILSNGDEARCLTVNEQIIGERRLGVPRRFGYCGNVIPLDKPGFESRIAEDSEALCEKIRLVGSNGVDFVFSDRLYLMEINPRFQNTIDCIERLLGINLVKEHIRACEGELGEYKRARRYAAKLILYAKWDTKAPDLTKFQGVVDIPPEGSIVRRGHPICSVLKFHPSRRKVIVDSFNAANEIYSSCRS